MRRKKAEPSPSAPQIYEDDEGLLRIVENASQAADRAASPDAPDADEEPARPRQGRLTSDERAKALGMYATGMTVAQIGRAMDRPYGHISRLVHQYRSTVKAARQYFEANAERLARRVVKQANVDQSIDVLDRIDVIPQQVSRSGAQFQVFIGTPGAAVPAPSERIMRYAQQSTTAFPPDQAWFDEKVLVDDNRDQNEPDAAQRKRAAIERAKRKLRKQLTPP